MPFASKAQRGYMHVHHPKIAARWDREYPDQKDLPERVKPKPKKKRDRRQQLVEQFMRKSDDGQRR